jgi:hypothetical protein
MQSLLLALAVASGILLVPEASQIDLSWWQKLLGIILVTGESILRVKCFSIRGVWIVYCVAVILGGLVLQLVLPVMLLICWGVFVVSCGRLVNSQLNDDNYSQKMELWGTLLVQVLIVLSL